MHSLKSKLLILLRKGFFHIIGSNTINKAVAFITNIALVRILTKSDFGVFTGAFNVFSVIFLFSGLGIGSGMLYFCSQKRSEESKNDYYRFCFIFGNLFNIILGLIILFYGLFAKLGIEETRPYIIMLSGMPIAGFWYDYYSIILRTQKDNKKYSLLLNINTISYAVFAVLGSLLFSITGTIIGRYISYVLSAIIGVIFARKYIDTNHKAVMLEKQARKGLFGYSIKAGLTSALNNILYLIDVYIIGIVVANASVLASYKVGAQIPENMNFIPQSMMVFFLPVFIEHAAEKEWLKKRTGQLYLGMAALSAVLSILLIVLAPFIVSILWGDQYIDAVPCFRILTISFFFLSTFRLTSTNILLSMGKAGYTLMISIVTGIANIILDVFMTIHFGSIGAAYATLIVTVLASVLSFPYVIHVVRSVKTV